ncbi:hypothetical protein [Phnomibacter ginsenosidimutans]|uniref:Uncharacterized protein n=1 Tax=Phnomibacter ginsenosidimutans TaxID=2676868 RepID=A0A6I6G9R3_9BACT|nr:hypothetical protein [Phnomibacter ginsenosidimutans]QGW28303.1 hypothetical protein GLV81_09510 [Phnomibacter ginsenosidimutans]
MDNSFFIFSEKNRPVQIERFHICTWEFNNDSSLVEFGFEVTKESITSNQLSISVFIPWFTKNCEVMDLYDKLSIAENSRFIFNDSISTTNSLDGGRNKLGVIHKFSDRNELCVIPVTIDKTSDKLITATINLQPYLDYDSAEKPNVYFRFWIKPTIPYISMRKKGISKSTIIYDIKVNERRNIPDDEVVFFSDKEFCKIKSSFSFNILPNKYDIVFFDNSSLKNVRTLEYDSFNKYLGDKRVKKDELLVVFNKKEVKVSDRKEFANSFSFFSIYSMERIGPGQYALAILINIICGVLLFIPGFRASANPKLSLQKVWNELPIEIYIALSIALVTLIYFILPIITSQLNKGWLWLLTKIGYKK